MDSRGICAADAVRVDAGIDPYVASWEFIRRGGCPHPPDGCQAACAARVGENIGTINGKHTW